MESQFAPVWFLSDDQPEHSRLAACQEVFARVIAKMDLEPAANVPFKAQTVSYALPDLGALSCFVSSASLYRRAADCRASDIGQLILLRPVNGAITLKQLGREATVTPGDAILLSLADAFEIDLSVAGRIDCLKLPRAVVTANVFDIDAALMRPVDKDTAALQLLAHYGGAILRGMLPLTSLAQQRTAANHIQDLVGLIFAEDGKTPDAQGIGAARLRAIKADIEENIGLFELSADMIATRQKVSPRYVQKLFESEGLSFSEFVLERRLERAWQLLRRPAALSRTISSIAFEVGFGDLSYFNRTFRRRFGMSPSQSRGKEAS